MKDWTLLVVGDDLSYLDFQRRILREAIMAAGARAQMFEVSDGTQALGLLSGTDFDCVILDHGLAGDSGLEWLARIRKANPELPVIMIAAGNSKSVPPDVTEPGATACLEKDSITSESLIQAIRDLLEKSARRKALPPGGRISPSG